MVHRIILAVLLISSACHGLDNGLALTPPMGWLSWARFTCNTDCANDPENCISERLYKDMADRLVSDGYQALGYEYVNIDDCWMEPNRDQKGKLVPDRSRFPNGIKSLADYVHSKGLKLGIYQDIGTKTCAGYPGSYGYFETDAATFAEWEIDMVKVDGCFADPKEMDTTYPIFSKAVNSSTRSILFSCEWPLYQAEKGIKPNYPQIAHYCNIWRNYHDVEISWQSVLGIVDYFAENQDEFVAVAGPGHWNDPDMILAGNSGLSFDQARAQLMLWSVMASPLLMSNDLRDMGEEYVNLLQNKEIIAVNQDSLGKMGKRIVKDGNYEVWLRPISPVKQGLNSFAVVFFNRNTLGGPMNITVPMETVTFDSKECYQVHDVYKPDVIVKHCPHDQLVARVNPSGAVMYIGIPFV